MLIVLADLFPQDSCHYETFLIAHLKSPTKFEKLFILIFQEHEDESELDE